MWHKTIEELPTEEKQYLLAYLYSDTPYYSIGGWSNCLHDVDDCDFRYNYEHGFYKYGDDGFYTTKPDYWCELNELEINND